MYVKGRTRLPYLSVQEIHIVIVKLVGIVALDLHKGGCCGRSAGKTLTVTDKVVCSEPTAFEVPVSTYRTWKRNDDATRFVFDKSAKTYRKLKMDVAASAPVKFSTDTIENPSRPDVQRLAFTFAEPVTEATFTTTYSSR